MSSIDWIRLPELGIEEIDREHREILDMIIVLRNVLRSDASDGMKRDALKDVLDAGISFVQNHFATEETLMLVSLYPAYTSHKKEHELFLGQLHDLQKRLQIGTRTPTVEMLNLMGNWLHHHVLETDRPLVPHLMKASLISQVPHAANQSGLHTRAPVNAGDRLGKGDRKGVEG
jgi:hemerythrin-like metal-binding protein